MNNQSCFNELIDKIIQFRNERDWAQFHQLKDLSMGLSIEASELMELLLWKSNEEIHDFISNPANKLRVEEELSDVLIYCMLIVQKLDLNIEDIVIAKLKKNADKYPVEKSKGKATKYSELN